MSAHCAICGMRLEDEHGQVFGRETDEGYVCDDPLDCCDELRVRIKSWQKDYLRVSNLNESLGKHMDAWEDTVKTFCSKYGVKQVESQLTPYTASIILESAVENAKATSLLEKHALLANYYQADINGSTEEQYAALKEVAGHLARDLHVAERLKEPLQHTVSLLKRVSSEGYLGWWEEGLLEGAEEILRAYDREHGK